MELPVVDYSSALSQPADPTKLSFLNLSRELQNMVYEHLFLRKDPLNIFTANGKLGMHTYCGDSNNLPHA